MTTVKQDRLLAELHHRDPDAAQHIRALMFTFDDLLRLEPRGVQELLRHLDHDQLLVALKGASGKMQNLFFANMSQRAATLIREDVAAMGPIRMNDAEAAQAAIADIAKSLVDAGKIAIQDDNFL